MVITDGDHPAISKRSTVQPAPGSEDDSLLLERSTRFRASASLEVALPYPPPRVEPPWPVAGLLQATPGDPLHGSALHPD